MEDALPWIGEQAAQIVERAAAWTGRRFLAGDIAFLPPIVVSIAEDSTRLRPVKTARAKRGLEMVAAWYEIPVFYFSNPNSLIGHEGEAFAPARSIELDYELELGVVIGKGGRDIAPEGAWEHVAGFAIVNDLSARDLQHWKWPSGSGLRGKDLYRRRPGWHHSTNSATGSAGRHWNSK